MLLYGMFLALSVGTIGSQFTLCPFFDLLVAFQAIRFKACQNHCILKIVDCTVEPRVFPKRSVDSLPSGMLNHSSRSGEFHRNSWASINNMSRGKQM
jgi:hypothetical protein